MHYKLAFEQHETPSSPEATALLNSSAHYLHLRARIEDSGSAEERWWAAVMLGQLFLYDTDKKVRTGFGHAAVLLRLFCALSTVLSTEKRLATACSVDQNGFECHPAQNRSICAPTH